MTLDPTSQLFKDAVAITGWPEWLCGDDRCILGNDATTWTAAVPSDGYTSEVHELAAQALLEHQFRVWLEEHGEGASVGPQSGGGYFAWLTCIGWMNFVYGDTYLECAMKAIVQVEKAKD